MLYLFSKSYITDSLNASYLFKNEDEEFEREYDDYYVSAILIIENTFIEYISTKFGISVSECKKKLESFDLSMRFSAFTDYALGDNNYFSNDYKRNFDELLKKYPLIRYMLWVNKSYSCNISSFNQYVEDAEKQLILN